MQPEERDPLTERIIGCTMEVHRALGPELLESAYTAALCIELELAGFSFARERSFAALYKGRVVGTYRPDIIVDDEVVLEIKSAIRHDPVFLAQMTSLRITGINVGLILNFRSRVMRDAVRRVSL
jgi:GxxExxY protein